MMMRKRNGENDCDVTNSEQQQYTQLQSKPIMRRPILMESIEKANYRRQRERERAAWRRRNETPEQTMLRRKKERERVAQRRKNEDPIQTQIRLKRDRERAALRRRREHPEQTRLRLERERQRTALRRRKLVQYSDKGCLNNNNTTTTTDSFPFQLSTKQNKKMMKMMPLLQTDSYSQKWPDIGDNSTTLPSTFCSSSITDIASNLSAIDDNLLSMRPKFLSVSSEYRCMLMTNLALFWKNGQYCDATLEAANSKIYVHKLLLLAISPKLQFKVKVPFSSFLRVIFPQGVDLAGLNAFADYMYHGILTLDQGLVAQLQTIAQQLNIEELDLLCKNQLISSDPKSYSEKSDFSASSNFPDVSILFTDANFHIKKESSDSLDYLTDSFEPVSINQTFPSENAIDHIQDIEDNLLSNHFQNPQATENFFEKKLPSLSQMTDPHDSTFINNTEFKNCANII